MSAVAVAYPPEDDPVVFSVRVDAIDDSRTLFNRSMVASAIVHLGVLVAALSFSLTPHSPPEVIATPVDHALDVSMIPISALETLLPRGVPQGQLPTAPPPSVVMPEPAQAPAVPEPPTPPAPSEKPKQEPRKVAKKEPVRPKSPAPSERPAESPEPQAATDSTDSSATARAVSSQQATGQGSSAQPFGVPDGEAISFEQARISYQDVIATRLARVKRYPERAIRRRMTGEGAIRLEISSDGSVAAVQIIRSTNTPILDEELRAMVDRAAPFPAFPADLRKNRLALIVPITFRLEG